MNNIDINKFAHISQLYISDEQKKDIAAGVVDVLDYTHKLNNIYDICFDQQIVENPGWANIFRDQSLTIPFVKNILYKNAPDMIEQYFHVPAMIKRK